MYVCMECMGVQVRVSHASGDEQHDVHDEHIHQVDRIESVSRAIPANHLVWYAYVCMYVCM